MRKVSTDDRSPRGQDPETQFRIRMSFQSKLSRTADRRKRLAILTACAKLKAPWVEAVFWDALDDSCEVVRGYVVKVLSDKADVDLKLALARLRRPPWYAKSASLKILGRHRFKEALEGIKGVVDDTNADVRCCAAEALGEIGGPEAVRLLVALRKDANSYVRQAAADALEKVSEVRFV